MKNKVILFGLFVSLALIASVANADTCPSSVKFWVDEENWLTGYDYSVMPQGQDHKGRPLADYGINLTKANTIKGPTIVKTGAGIVFTVFLGEQLEIGDSLSKGWFYLKDTDLDAQLAYFPEPIYRIDRSLYREAQKIP